MPFRFTNIHMTAHAAPNPLDPWAYPKSSTKSSVAAPMIVRPPRSSSLKGQQAIAIASTTSKPKMKLIPLSVAASRNDIKYRKEAFEVEERAMHLKFMGYALKA